MTAIGPSLKCLTATITIKPQKETWNNNNDCNYDYAVLEGIIQLIVFYSFNCAHCGDYFSLILRS